MRVVKECEIASLPAKRNVLTRIDLTLQVFRILVSIPYRKLIKLAAVKEQM